MTLNELVMNSCGIANMKHAFVKPVLKIYYLT